LNDKGEDQTVLKEYWRSLKGVLGKVIEDKIGIEDSWKKYTKNC